MISDFDRSSLVTENLSDDDMVAIKARLIEFEAEARRDPDRSSSFLWNSYASLTIPDRLISNLIRRLRTDTDLILNGISETPLHLAASILNRFLVFLLMRHGGLHYFQGQLVDISQIDKGYQIRISHKGAAERLVQADDVIIRHGVVSDIRSWLPHGAEHTLRSRIGLADPTEQPLWPIGFYGERPRSTPALIEGPITNLVNDLKPGSKNAQAEILKRMEVKSIPGVYVLGCYATRVTFGRSNIAPLT